MRRVLGAVALLFACFGGGAADAQIKIAAAGPMTGQYAAFGQQLREGAEQAVADINAHGGVLGQKLELQMGDDACDPRQAVSVANQLAGAGVKFVAGHYCSGSSIPASKVYADEGILEISPASTNPKYTDDGGWNTFRTCGRDDQQGQVAGSYLAAHFKVDKIAILDDNTAYGHGLANETRRALNAAGVKEAMDATYTPGERDYSALVSRMKAAGIGVIYVGGYHIEAGLIIRQAREQGMTAIMVGADALVTQEFWQIAGPAANGTLMTFPADPRGRPGAAAVVAEFRARHVDPEGYVLYTYAAVQVWAAAAAKAGSVDGEKVAAVLKSGGPWDSVLGQISFDAKGDVRDSGYVFYQWENGTYSQM
jgi:branched-chain amino acid transport system substrate-binding protein